MEGKQIRVLDEHMINLIAAGEVIERASSVVKELVENSIDAGSKNIQIALKDAGLKEITVTDDGCGMDEYNIKIAILPHSTSKLEKSTDLYNISTLGFRGEALASILAVSKTKIKSSTGGRGVMLGITGGVITSEALIAYPRGTEIRVSNLFFNTPARLQNLKSEGIELGYITEFVQKIALANPDIAFKLINNDKIIFQTFGSGQLLEVVSNIYGVDVAKNMVDFCDTNGLFKVFGLTSNLQVTRSSKQNMTIIVNGRVVKNPSIQNAIIAGYKTLLTVGRFPVTVLIINVDYSLVDVNVHPTKSEVRFSDEKSLVDLISGAINSSLMSTNLIINDSIDAKNPWDIVELDDDAKDDEELVEETKELEETDETESALDEEEEPIEDSDEIDKILSDDDNLPDFLKEVKNDYLSSETVEFKKTNIDLEVAKVNEDEKKEEIAENTSKQVQLEIDFVNNSVYDGQSDRLELKKLYYIGQLFNTYMLAQNEEGFYLIDQHAANERINYEQIYEELKSEDVKSYEPLVPIKLHFSFAEAIKVLDKLEELQNLGIYIEEFGDETFIARLIPLWMKRFDPESYVEEIVTSIIDDKKTEKMDFLDSLAKSMACKRSIKGNEFISEEQVETLLNDLVKCKVPFTCPHGRPIIVRFSKSEIEKWFKRINA